MRREIRWVVSFSRVGLDGELLFFGSLVGATRRVRGIAVRLQFVLDVVDDARHGSGRRVE